MTPASDMHDLLAHTTRLALQFLDGVDARPVGARASRTDLEAALGGPLPDTGTDAITTLTQLAASADPGLVASAGPRFFGFVTGGAVPVSVAAEWLASTWDQNGALYVMSPAAAVIEDIAARWVLGLLGLPSTSSVGFVTGCHMANVTCLAAARHEVLRRAGWDVERRGLQQAPRVHVVIGDEAHVSILAALRLLGIGTDEVYRVPVDTSGRMRTEALDATLAALTGPCIVCAQAGQVNTGASDPFEDLVAAAHAHGAWVHVDGAFGLWAAAVPELRAQVAGVSGADSWATDAHKWLNVPYDSGLAIVAHPAPHRAAMGMQASYLQRGGDEDRSGIDWTPESSRRVRGLAVYALLRTLGAEGVRDLIRGTCARAREMADALGPVPGVQLVHPVVLNQVLVRFDGPDPSRTTREVIAAVQADGTCWAGGAEWQGQAVMRISVSNWRTTSADIARSAEAITRCYVALRSGQRA